MADKRTRKTAAPPFVAGAAAMTEAMLAPAKSAGLVPDAALPEALPPVAQDIAEAITPKPVRKVAQAVADVAPEAAPAPPADPVATVEAAPPPPAEPEVAVEVLPAPFAAAVEAVVDKLETATTTMPNPAMLGMASPFMKGLMKMATAPETTYVAAEKFQSVFGDVNERAKTAVEKSSKMAEELTELTKGNVEAFVASGRVAAKGAESMTQEAAEYGKKSFESATGAFKSFAAVKSPTELFQLQSEYAKSSFESMVAEASKVSESVLKLMGEIAQPLSTRYAVAAEKIKSATSL